MLCVRERGSTCTVKVTRVEDKPARAATRITDLRQLIFDPRCFREDLRLSVFPVEKINVCFDTYTLSTHSGLVPARKNEYPSNLFHVDQVNRSMSVSAA